MLKHAADEYGIALPPALRLRSGGLGGSLPDDYATALRSLVENTALTLDPTTVVKGISRVPCFMVVTDVLATKTEGRITMSRRA